MVFTKDNLAVMVTFFTEKGWTCTLNPLDYCTWDILQELVYEGRREPFNRFQTSEIFGMSSETKCMMMIRQ